MTGGDGCGVCEPPDDLGNFLGQYTLDTPSGDGWVWLFSAGQLTFLAGEDVDGGFLLDAASPLEYCSSCERDALDDRGLKASTSLSVYKTS